MKLLFKNETEITKDKVMRFNYFNLFNNKILMVILLYMPIIWMASGIGMFIKEGDIKRLIISTLLSAGWLLIIFLPPYLGVKMGYKTENYSNEYEFYEDKFVAKNKFTKDEVYYNALYKVYETKNFFYFYINKKSALIVEKDEKLSEEFSSFMKEKLTKRYKKRKL